MYLLLNAFTFFFTTNSLRPPIATIVMVTLALLGFVNGLVTMRVLKFFGQTDWVFAAVISAVAYPCFIYICLGIETILNASVGGYH